MDIRNASIFELEGAFINRVIVQMRIRKSLQKIDAEIEVLKNLIAQKKGIQINTEIYKNTEVTNG